MKKKYCQNSILTWSKAWNINGFQRLEGWIKYPSIFQCVPKINAMWGIFAVDVYFLNKPQHLLAQMLDWASAHHVPTQNQFQIMYARASSSQSNVKTFFSLVKTKKCFLVLGFYLDSTWFGVDVLQCYRFTVYLDSTWTCVLVIIHT